MKEERLNINSNDLDRYLEQAQQLRTRELARLSSQLFKMPNNLLSRIGSSLKGTLKGTKKTVSQN